MTGTNPEVDGLTTDPWARWILRDRFGDDREMRARILPNLLRFRDNVLRGAQLQPGDVVLDVGCGDGLLGIEALRRIGEHGIVIFCDISDELLAQCREAAAGLGRAHQCRFVRSGLPELSEVADESVDAVVIRSVLMYVPDREASFASLFRVLRPGGRLSLFEPINSFGRVEPADQLLGFDVGELAPVADKVKRTYRQHLPSNGPIVSFDERDLLAHAQAAGFDELSMDYHAEIGGSDPIDISWEVLIRRPPNPLVPPLRDILDEALTGPEQAALAARIQAQIQAGRRRRRQATVYLTGRASAASTGQAGHPGG